MKWEYMVTEQFDTANLTVGGDYGIGALNELGEQGWEIIYVKQHFPPSFFMILRRRKEGLDSSVLSQLKEEYIACASNLRNDAGREDQAAWIRRGRWEALTLVDIVGEDTEEE